MLMEDHMIRRGSGGRGIEPGCFLWTPPPAAADVALEEMRKARIKRQLSTHIFVCPRLLTTEWLKQCHKATDCLFELPVGFSVWPEVNS